MNEIRCYYVYALNDDGERVQVSTAFTEYELALKSLIFHREYDQETYPTLMAEFAV